MAKKSKKDKNPSSSTMSAHAKIMQAKRRRDSVLLGVVGVLAIGAIGALIWFFATLENKEEDYSIVGLGEPVIVQIHQLNCNDCDILRANTKRALNEIDDDRLHYRIAYLHKPEGIAFASKHGAARREASDRQEERLRALLRANAWFATNIAPLRRARGYT